MKNLESVTGKYMKFLELIGVSGILKGIGKLTNNFQYLVLNHSVCAALKLYQCLKQLNKLPVSVLSIWTLRKKKKRELYVILLEMGWKNMGYLKYSGHTSYQKGENLAFRVVEELIHLLG